MRTLQTSVARQEVGKVKIGGAGGCESIISALKHYHTTKEVVEQARFFIATQATSANSLSSRWRFSALRTISQPPATPVLVALLSF